ncbi:hypothetical protein NX059_007493 [Plenodomus lindquistii]|nr:hypothetical protein NX059_007493 [Plenodomus lindquistii]
MTERPGVKLGADSSSCNDEDSRLIARLFVERQWAPYALPPMEPSPMQAYLVYISHFTNDNINVAYYVEEAHFTTFLAGTFGRQAYSGPALITPIGLSTRDDLLNSATKLVAQSITQLRVTKRSAPMETVRWRYLFETARIQWSKLRFDHSRWERLRYCFQAAPIPRRNKRSSKGPSNTSIDLEAKVEEHISVSDDEWEISSATSQEACDILASGDGEMARSGELEEPDDDNESAVNEPAGNAGGDVSSQAQGDDIDILQLLSSIPKSCGKRDDLLAYLANRDVSGKIVGARGLAEKVTGLVDTLELIDDLNLQSRMQNQPGSPMSDNDAKLRMELCHDRDEVVADIHKSLALSQNTKNNADEDSMAASPCTDEKIKRIDMVMKATGESAKVASRLLDANNWSIGKVMEFWFEVIEKETDPKD